MKGRPEYVKCVLTGRYDRPDDHPLGAHLEQKTWCGEKGTETILAFRDPTHAILNAADGGRLLVCPECSVAMASALAQGTWDGAPDEESDDETS